MKLRVGTRPSKLALLQVKEIISQFPGHEFEIIHIYTSGDIDKETSLVEKEVTSFFSDKIEEFGLTLVEFSSSLKEKIKTHLISLVKLINPLDMIGVAGELQYYEVTKAMLEDPGIDIVVPCLVIPPFLEMSSDEHYRGMIRAWNDTNRKKPMIPLIFFAEDFEELKKFAKSEKAPIFYTPQEAAFAVKILVERSRIVNKVL